MNPFEQALALLNEAAIDVSGDLTSAQLRLVDGTRVTAIVKFVVTPSPARIASDCSNAAPRRLLYILEKTGRAALDAAGRGDVDLVSLDQRRVVILGQDRVVATHRSQNSTRRLSATAWAVARVRLLARSAMTQSGLATAIGVTQQAVAKAVRNGGLDELTIDDWVRGYPGAGGLRSYWYHLDPVIDQGRLTLDALKELGLKGLRSGDLAADDYEPWRNPVQGHVYSEELIDLSPWGFVDSTADEATLVLQVPADRTAWATGEWFAPGRGLVDPLIALWDLARARGSDAIDAAERLKASIVNGTLSA